MTALENRRSLTTEPSRILAKRLYRGHTFDIKTAISLPNSVFFAAERQAKWVRVASRAPIPLSG
jgi:hypothetical protein